MDGLLMRGWGHIIPGVSGLSVRSAANERSRSATGVSTPCEAVSTPGDHRSCPQVVGLIKLWKDFQSGDGNLSCPGCADSMKDPQPTSDRPVGL